MYGIATTRSKKNSAFNILLSVTVMESLDGPLKPQMLLLTLNVQFLAVADSDRLEQVAEVPVLEQLPQSEMMGYLTVEQLGST